jgi:hypothetical protein
MLFLWIVLGIAAYLLLAVAVGRFLSVNRLSRIRDGIFEEALPSAPTGSRGEEGEHPGFRWTQAENLTALDHDRTPAEKRAVSCAETGEPVRTG